MPNYGLLTGVGAGLNNFVDSYQKAQQIGLLKQQQKQSQATAFGDLASKIGIDRARQVYESQGIQAPSFEAPAPVQEQPQQPGLLQQSAGQPAPDQGNAVDPLQFSEPEREQWKGANEFNKAHMAEGLVVDRDQRGLPKYDKSGNMMTRQVARPANYQVEAENKFNHDLQANELSVKKANDTATYYHSFMDAIQKKTSATDSAAAKDYINLITGGQAGEMTAEQVARVAPGISQQIINKAYGVFTGKLDDTVRNQMVNSANTFAKSRAEAAYTVLHSPKIADQMDQMKLSPSAAHFPAIDAMYDRAQGKKVNMPSEQQLNTLAMALKKNPNDPRANQIKQVLKQYGRL